ncbi:MAG: PAS domain-containing protein [Campylobacterales bacterium]
MGHDFSFYDQVVAPVIITDAQLDLPGPRIIYVNPAACAMTGYTREELIGQTPRIFQGELTHRPTLDALKETLRRGEPFVGQIVNYNKSREPYHVEWTISPIRNENNEITAFISIQKDISWRIRYEAQQEELLIQQGKLAAMSEMIGEAIHQWRQPINAIGLCFQNIEMMIKENPIDIEGLETVVAAGLRQVQLMDRTLELFKSITKMDKNDGLFDLGELVGDVIELFTRFFSVRGITLKTDLPSGIMIYGNKDKVRQILLTLLSNSADAYTERDIRSGTILVTLSRNEEYAFLDYRDDAGGIPEEIISKIFDYRFTTKGEKGSGIGLALARRFAQQMKGEITVRNEEKGAWFRTIFPFHS